jgi:hypothetical protein
MRSARDGRSARARFAHFWWEGRHRRNDAEMMLTSAERDTFFTKKPPTIGLNVHSFSHYNAVCGGAEIEVRRANRGIAL